MSESIYLTQLPSNFHFPEAEEEIVKYWNVNKIYSKTVEKNINKPTYNAIDGPPFVSGALHHGHCHIGMMKSSINNYWTMKGYNVLNKIGYDVHGLPSELNANKNLGLKTNADVQQYGIGNYNNYCVNMINEMMGSWHPTFDRIGRFFDKTNEYKTMDLNYMESTWWVWKQLWNKGLTYLGYKIMPYSIECGTSLSSSEATGEEVYKEVTDPSVYVKFLMSEESDALSKGFNTYFIAWTTTPWTLPSNLVLAVNPKLKYVTVLDKKTSSSYVIAENCLNRLYPAAIGDIRPFEILNSYLGSELLHKEYEPLFPYYKTDKTDCQTDRDSNKFFKIVSADFVDDSSGTGIVHIAPAFGSEDFDLCISQNIVSIEDIGKYCPIDENGTFIEKVTDFAGQKIFDANKKIIEMLHSQGKVVRRENYRHRYPHCWRTDTPLISKAVSSFFIKVSSMREDLVKNNEKVKWIPENIGSGRFKNWIENASDWGVSRTRFFGTPIPVWISDDGEEMVCVGSIKELYELSGIRVTNLHLDHIKDILIPSKEGRGMLKHCQDVLDCWFESAVVPIAQYHYPFENKELVDSIVKTGYLSEIVCEGADQCNKWFYVLSVISTALWNIPAYKHVICNGLILAKDGQKFSKRLANFVPPLTVCNKIGADALRMYFIGSPASHGSSFTFKEESIEQINFKYYQWLNGVKFFIEHHTKYCKDGNVFSLNDAFVNPYFSQSSLIEKSKDSQKSVLDDYKKSINVTDNWILSRVGNLIANIDSAMSSYLIYKVKLEIMDFIEDLVNWYIKFNRNRFRGRYCDGSEQGRALSTLYRVLITFSQITAPFVPFLSETLYGTLKPLLPITTQCQSVHLCSYPIVGDFPFNEIVIRQMKNYQLVVNLVRSLRSKTQHFHSVRVPIKNVTIIHEDLEFLNDIQIFEKYLYEDLNSIHITYSNSVQVKYKMEPNIKLLGSTFKKLANPIKEKLKLLSQEEILNYLSTGKDELNIMIGNTDITVKNEMFSVIKDKDSVLQKDEIGATEQGCMVVLNIKYDEEVIQSYLMRLFVGGVQKLRKNTNLRPWNKILIYYSTDDEILKKSVENNLNKINEELMYSVIYLSDLKNITEKVIVSNVENLDNHKVTITITEL
jgi:isoleucyl-tRNA synthetase